MLAVDKKVTKKRAEKYFAAINERKNKIFVGMTTKKLSARKKDDWNIAQSRHAKGKDNISSRLYLKEWVGTDLDDWEYIEIGNADMDIDSLSSVLIKLFQTALNEKMDIIGFPINNLSMCIDSPDKLRKFIQLKKAWPPFRSYPNDEKEFQSLNNISDFSDTSLLQKAIATWPPMLRKEFFGEDQIDYIYNSIFDLKNVKIEEERFLPVVYLKFYPTRNERYSEADFQCYRYIQGLKYIMQDNFVGDDPTIIDKNKSKKGFLNDNNGIAGYAADFEKILSKRYSGPLILTGIPSSKVGKINIIERIIQLLALKDSRFIDGRCLISKNTDEVTAHESKEKRKIGTHINSWNKSIDFPKEWLDYPVVVMDDVNTSGSSFDAADIHLIDNLGFDSRDIVNFSFGKTYPNIYVENELDFESKKKVVYPIKDDNIFDNVIFDMDHTIFGSDYLYNYQNGNYEIDRSLSNIRLLDKEVVKKIFDLLSTDYIQYAFVTHRKKSTAEAILEKYKDIIPMSSDSFLLCPYDFEDEKTNSSLIYKPSPLMINEARKVFKKRFKTPRILGIGNSEADIMAYSNAKIFSVLGTWDNRALKTNTCYANKTIDSLDELYKFFEKHISDYDRDWPF